MKFNCGPTEEERRADKLRRWFTERDRMKNWRPWFAWYPVRVASHDCRWLETVEYRATGDTYTVFGWKWEYRAKGSE
jgi:hypothetical protein